MSKSFHIDTSPTKELLVSNLTRDASTEACIFDLIDNSIDAARDCIFAKAGKNGGTDKLPTSYSGYSITLKLDGDSVQIQDNCGGMDFSSLSDDNLRFGQPSEHNYGIGLYGVGLNRAIFKLGNNTVLETESAKPRRRSRVEIDRKEYLNDQDNWDIVGESATAKGKAETRIKITNLDPPISRVTSDEKWRVRIKNEIEKRYAQFLSKGLRITFNRERVEPNLVQVRQDGPFPPFNKSFKLDSETAVFIEAGQHIDHRFSAEPDYEMSVNRDITDQYGWSVVCNDRVIVHLDTSEKTGWVKKWHGEFNGFVGYVCFTSKDPRKLPWNTPKTDIDPNHEGYDSVLKDMRDFTEQWRAYANEAKKTKSAGKTLKPQAKKGASSKSSKTKKKIVRKKTKKPVIKAKQTQLPFVLPDDIDERHCSDKLLQLVHEGKKISIFEAWYTALALIRILFETCARSFLIRHNEYSNCVAKVIAKREAKKGKALTADQRKHLVPDLEELIWLFSDDQSLWLDSVGKQMNQSLAKFAKHKERMNSAIHHPFQGINHTEVLQIRDEVLPMLRRLIER